MLGLDDFSIYIYIIESVTLCVGMAQTRPLAPYKVTAENAEVIGLFRQTTCSASASIYTLKLRKMYSYDVYISIWAHDSMSCSIYTTLVSMIFILTILCKSSCENMFLRCIYHSFLKKSV